MDRQVFNPSFASVLVIQICNSIFRGCFPLFPCVYDMATFNFEQVNIFERLNEICSCLFRQVRSASSHPECRLCSEPTSSDAPFYKARSHCVSSYGRPSGLQCMVLSEELKPRSSMSHVCDRTNLTTFPLQLLWRLDRAIANHMKFVL